MESSASYQELVPMTKPPVQPQPKPFKRPISYSDSFFFIPTSLDPLELTASSEISSNSVATLPEQEKGLHQESVCIHRWLPIGLSFLFHITLISLFESLFFLLFISKSEDKGIDTTVNHLIGTLTSTCPWPANQTQLISDMLGIFIDPSTVQNAAWIAAQQRNTYNSQIFLRAWMYSAGFVGATLLAFAVSIWRKWISGRKIRIIICENVGLVAMLGLYEFIFFKTIIYQYDSVSISEIEGNIVGMLQTQCGLLTQTI